MNTPISRALRLLPLAVATTLAGVLAGCAATSPAPVLLTLPPAVAIDAAAAPAPAPGAPPQVLAVQRIDVPEYLAARRVRFRADASTLAEWPNTYWAERIEIGASREFTAALRQQLPGWRLCEANCSEQSASLSARVELTRMDFIAGEQRLVGSARLAVWSADRTPRLLRSEERAYTLPADARTPQAHAQAITELLRRVAVDTAGLVNAASAR
jgi:uncharacterized lipoprotein YmbA